MKRTARLGLVACLGLLGLPGASLGREVELHVGAHVFSAEAAPYEATVQVGCPSARAARIGVGGQLEGGEVAELAVELNGSAAGTLRVDEAAPTHWLDVQLPAGENRVRIVGPASAVVLRSSYVGVVLLDDAGCTIGAACPELAEVAINCAGLEPFICDLLGIESNIYCKQLEIDRAALRYQKYPNPTLDIWTPEDRAIYNRLAPQLELLVTRQQELYARLEELSRKQPRQLKGYLDVHRNLETHYQRALAASR